MDRRILLALCAIAGICAAILLFPTREKEDADVAVGHDHAAPVTATTKSRPVKTRINEAPSGPLPGAKDAAAEAREAHFSTPYYEHTKAAAKRWLALGNLLTAEGDTEAAQRARAIARALRSASRMDGSDDAREEAAAGEVELIAELQAKYTEGEIAEILAYLGGAAEALRAGAAPPAAEEGAEGGDPAAAGSAGADAPPPDAEAEAEAEPADEPAAP